MFRNSRVELAGNSGIESWSRPHLCARIATTGHHRAERLPDDQIARVTLQVERVLVELSSQIQHVANERASTLAYSSAPACLRLISPLAERADRIVAAAALSTGWELHALLPFPAHEYEKDFVSQDSVNEFRKLLSHARSIFSFDAPSKPDKRVYHYSAVGRLMLNGCDILITLWDGEAAQGPGGAPDVIAEAQRMGVPVIWIHTKDASCDPRILMRDQWYPFDEMFTGDQLNHQLMASFFPPETVGSPRPRHIRNRKDTLGRFLQDSERPSWPPTSRGPRWWLTYDWLIQKLVSLGAPRHRDETHSVLTSVPAVEDASQLDFRRLIDNLPTSSTLRRTLVDRLSGRYERTDLIATYLGRAYRSAYVLNFLFAASAVVSGLLSIFWWDSLLAKVFCISVESAWIGLVLLLTYSGRVQQWHERWLQARRLAELLRPVPVLACVGHFGYTKAGEMQAPNKDDWVNWYALASLRELMLPSAIANTDYLRDLIDAAIRYALDPQIAYHAKSHARLSSLHHGLDWLGEKLFWITLWIGLSFIPFAIFVFSHQLHAGFWYDLTKSFLKPLITFLSAGLPAIGAALAGIRAQGDFHVSAERSHQTQKTLMDIRERLLKERNDPEFWTVRELLVQAAKGMTADLESWNQLYLHRPILLPM